MESDPHQKSTNGLGIEKGVWSSNEFQHYPQMYLRPLEVVVLTWRRWGLCEKAGGLDSAQDDQPPQGLGGKKTGSSISMMYNSI